MPEERPDLAPPGEDAPSMRRRLEEYERWFRSLDSQTRVLERERQKLSAVMNHADAGFLVMNPDRRIVWANDAVARILGRSGGRAGAEGRSCHQVVCGEAAPCASCPAAVPPVTGSVAHGELRTGSGEGARHIYATAMPIASPEGAVDQTILMLQDVSDLKVLRDSQEALRSSEQRFRSIFTHAGAGMAMVSAEGVLLESNPALCALLERAPGDLERLELASITYAEDRGKVREALARAGQSGAEPEDVEIRYVERRGGIVWGRTSLSCIAGADGRPDCFVLLVQDITERKQLERELQQAEKMSAVGLLVSGVAHELNNPLAGVLGYSQLLMREESSEKVRRRIEAIHHEAERCKRIVQNLQTFARKHKPQEVEVRINDLLMATLEMKAYQLQVDNIRVVKDLDDSLPTTRADHHQLQQVFLNLIVNAHQAILDVRRAGTLTLRTRRVEADIVVEIEDDGPGIRPENLSRIFDPFFTTKEVGQGTGLGLSICYGIVKEHEGRIAARNADSGGAIITVELPIRAAAPAAAAQRAPKPIPPPAPTLRSERPARPPASGSQARILVVDDEPSVLDVVSQALRLDGHKVSTAADAMAALDLLGRDRYDAIVSDLKMPGMSGQDFYEELRRRDPDHAARMIFATGDTLSPLTAEFLESAQHRCLSKPFELDELRDMIRGVLSGGR